MHGTVTCRWRQPRSWQRLSTTVLSVRGQEWWEGQSSSWRRGGWTRRRRSAGSWASVLPWTSTWPQRLWQALLQRHASCRVRVPPVVVEHDEEKEKKQSGMSEGLVVTDGGPPVAEAVESMQAPQMQRVKKWSRCSNTPGRRTAKKSRNRGPR